jgi:hypothetical protein
MDEEPIEYVGPALARQAASAARGGGGPLRGIGFCDSPHTFHETGTMAAHPPFATGWHFALCLASACVFPNDESRDLTVTVDAPSELVVPGEPLPVTAHVRRLSASGNLELIPGAEIRWTSSDAATASVAAASDGSATVTGLQSGTAEIAAYAVGFENAVPGILAIRVASSVEIDSIVPAIVRYGELVTIYGVGLGNLVRVSLGQADLIPDKSTFAGDRSGLGRLGFWVPYPAETGRAAAVSLQGATALAPVPTTVIPVDLYHELGVGPPRIDVSGPPVRPPDTLYHNPALALTTEEESDGFRIALSDTGRAITITISTQTPAVTLFDPVVSLGAEPIERSLEEGHQSSWVIGLGGQICRAIPAGSGAEAGAFIPFTRPVLRTGPVTVIRALKDLPAADLLLGIIGDPPGRYSLTIEEGYKTADPRIPADRFEENDHCLGADINHQRPATSTELPFSDTLTIDNPYEVDWFRFTVPGDPGDGISNFLTAKVAARPFGARDSSDLGMLLVTEFGASTEVHTVGSSETLNAELSAGDYYLIVLDEAGVPTRYSMCIAIGSDCQFSPGSEN